MRFRYVSVFILLFFLNNSLHAGRIIVSNSLNKVYVISIGISREDNNITARSFYVNAPCEVCLSDAKGFPVYLNDLKKKLPGTIDSVISYSYINADIDVDELYKTFRKIQDQAKAGDVFVFYYAGSAWGMHKNVETGNNEGFYLINNKQKDSANVARYSFTLSILKALTDRIAAQRQLIIFDTGNGQVIAPDYYKNFFSDNPAKAFFTKKNRIVICPENISSESVDEKTGVYKGDLFKVISSMPDSLNVFTFFDTEDHSSQSINNYKNFMKDWYAQQLHCRAQLKVLQEKEYLQILTAIKPDLANRKRGADGDEPPETGKVDSTFGSRKKKALVIATNIYEASLWRPLRNPVNDGRAVAEILQKDYGYQVDTLFNAAGDIVLDAISRLCDDVENPYSQYIIYFAGHGYYDPKQKTGYVVCRDSKPIKELYRPSMSELKSYLDYTVLFKKIDASLNKVVLITDVCFGGTALNSVLPINPNIDPKAGKDKLKNPYKRVLASGITEVDDFIRLQSGEISGNSPFAMALMDILKNKKEHLSFETLFSDIAQKKLSPDPVDFIFGSISKPSEFIF